jgi:putative peptidoglycan lipid II flippase
MASLLGAGMCADALLVALRLANTFRRIFAEGAFNASFLPRFSRILNNEGREKANVVLVDVFWILLFMTIAFSLVVMIFYPSILLVIVSGFDVLSEKFRLTTGLGRLCFPYLVFISTASLLAGVLNSVGKFALPAITHSLMSLFSILGLLVGYYLELSNGGVVYLLSCLVLLSGVAQLIVLYISVRHHGFRLAFHWRWSRPVRDIMKNMIPGILGAGVWQLNILIDTMVSSHFPTGSITCINLADRLVQFPLGTLGIAFSTVLLPTLAKHMGAEEYDRASAALRESVLTSSFFSLGATALLLALAQETVAVAFQRGLFQQDQVRITAETLVGLTVGLPAFMLTKIFSSLYFANGDTKTPVFFGICSIIVNLIGLVLLVPFNRYMGIAMGTSLSAVANAFLLLYFAPRNVRIKNDKEFKAKILSQLCAAIGVYLLVNRLSGIFWRAEMGSQSVKWLVYMAIALVGAAVFCLITFLGHFLTGRRYRRRFRRF